MIDILLDRARTGLENLENPAILFWHFPRPESPEKKDYGSWKNKSESWENPWNLFLKRGTNPVRPSDFFRFFFFSSFSVFFPSLYKFKKCLVHKRVKKN